MVKQCDDCSWFPLADWKAVCKKCYIKRLKAGKSTEKSQNEKDTELYAKESKWGSSPAHVRKYHYKKNRKGKTGRGKYKYKTR